MAEGIRKRNRPKPYEASVYVAAERRQVRQSFRTMAEARQWRRDALRGIKERGLAKAQGITVDQAAADFLKGMETGAVRNRSGWPYKPATIRSYTRALKLGVLPVIGKRKLAEVTVQDVRALVRRFRDQGLSDSTVRNRLDPLRAIYRYAEAEDLVDYNPTAGLRLANGRNPRTPSASFEEVAALIDALRPADRPLWAAAFYAGLRRGELRALRVCDLDFERNEIHVRRSWDDKKGVIEPKTEAGKRIVSMAEVLRYYLDDQRIEQRRSGEDLIFGRTAELPFVPSSVGNRAKTDWKRAGLDGVTLHEARHLFASFLIYSGEEPKAISEQMGHSSIATTFDTYGHLLPGSRAETKARLDRHLVAPDRVGSSRVDLGTNARTNAKRGSGSKKALQ